MQGAAPSYLAHPIKRGLSTILLVGGLGVEDKPKGASEVPNLLHVISFRGAGSKTKSVDLITSQLAAFLSVTAERRSILYKNCFTSIYGGRE